MSTISASAPGKIVLSGEYAVLDGAPAICMAVDSRVTVRLASSGDNWHSVSAPGYSHLEGRFLADGAEIEWLQGAEEFRIVDAVWRTLRPATSSALSIELDSRAFVDSKSGEKIGIGSSAALIVALTAALCRSRDVLDSAMRAHRLLQHGRGSGADIATSLCGGLIEYRLNESAVNVLRWPEGLAYRLIWTGVPASTSSRLDRLESQEQRASRQELAVAAGSMATSWNSAATVLRELPTYIDALRQFSVDHDLGIFDAGHEQLTVGAAAAGLVYKPCGAGGGDVGILLGSSDEALDEFVTDRVPSGCEVLCSKLEHDGLLLEQS